MLRIRNISGKAHPHMTDRVRLYTGDLATSKRPMVLEAVLGSCVAVCLHDPSIAAGGMNHILLPGSAPDAGSTRYGVNAMELLINELMKQGGDRRRFVAKAFGGGNVLPGLTTAMIGTDNARFVRGFLSAERIPLVAECLGGTHPVQVFFETNTGKATVRCVDCARKTSKIAHAEVSYWHSHTADKDLSGEITLF